MHTATDLLEWDLFNTDSSEGEEEGTVPTLNVAGQPFVADVMAQLPRAECHVKYDLGTMLCSLGLHQQQY